MKSDNKTCVTCIKNMGLKWIAEEISSDREQHFEACGHTSKYLDAKGVEELAYKFFVAGSVPPSLGGRAPVYNIKSAGLNELIFESELDADIALLSQHNPLCLYHYGPPLHKIGATTHYQDLVFKKVTGDERKKIWDEVIGACETVFLDINTRIFRARNGKELPPALAAEFDSSPTPKEGRYNRNGEHIFYGAFDVETCLHEVRVKLSDWIAIATFKVSTELKLLDLTRITDPLGTEFESISILINKIVFSDENEYPLCQELSSEIRSRGYDGFIISSYFRQAHKKALRNIILFDKPAEAGKLYLDSTNKVNLESIAYDYSFGPMRDNKKVNMEALHRWSEEFKSQWKLLEENQIDLDGFGKFVHNHLKGLGNDLG
ncbi:RES family NAD+ phosphorylase [Pantoea dispersa]|uniref:RES family NAD+ phosphorylase n=1 Tax=Pantoea dispersa TaxID=59814 RepID=UPI0007373AC9|nr:RES family NAD+ phosphorylase [Pantoea dispersa]KTR98487.1 hypothetical protein NS375_16325 [Pantoea dispersa]